MDSLDTSKIIADLVQNNLEKILQGIHSFSKGQIADLNIRTKRAFVSYLERSSERNSKVKTLIHRTTPVNIYDFYVPSNLDYEGRTVYTNSIEDLLEISSCCMILGSGGTGKSTLFKHLFLNSLYTTEKIPIFVSLRDINGSSQSLIECIYESLANFGFTLEKTYFTESLDKGIYNFFFDGFDEVEENQQKRIIREISIMTNKYNLNNYLVSSRVLDSISMGWEEFTDFTMKPFNKGQALELLEKLPYDEDIKVGFIQKLNKSLYEDHQSFCSNPLLLTLMLMTYDEFADIPDKIHVFYSQAYEVLYSKHDATKPGFNRFKKMDKFNIGSDGFTKILEVISAASYLDDKIFYTGAELSDYINNAKKMERLEFDTEDYKSDLVQAICILIMDGLKYTYQHRTFQEYFTAKYINRQSEERQSKMLIKLLTKKSLSVKSDQVLNILMDLNRKMVEKQLIIPLLKELKDKITKETKELSNIHFLKTYTPNLTFRVTKNPYNNLRLQYSIMALSKNDAIMPLLDYVEYVYGKKPGYSFFRFNSSNNAEKRRGETVKTEEELFNKVVRFAKTDDEIERLKVSLERMFNRYETTPNQFGGYIIFRTKIENIIEDPSLKVEVFEIAEAMLRRLDYNLNLLDCLEKEHKEIDNLEDSFF